MKVSAPRLFVCAIIFAMSAITIGCVASAKNEVFFGKTDPPKQNILRYVSGSEPQSIDPQIPNTQNEARICLALYDGLEEYDPKTGDPIPALAQGWEANKDWSEFVFHLRHDGRFSNGDPITARDFVYTIRRGLTPGLGSRTAGLAYPIKYAEEYNEGGIFVFDPGQKRYLLARDFLANASEGANKPAEPLSSQPIKAAADEYSLTPGQPIAADTQFHQLMHSPQRLVLPKSEKDQKSLLDANPKLSAAVKGKQLVPVKAEDLGVEAVDDYTLRISLAIPAPYFIGLMPHQFFRVLNQKTIEKFGNAWTDPANIVSSGAFKLQKWNHYDRIVVTRDPMNWDAANVRLDGIIFYLIQDNATMMSLYKAGEIDATYNHTVPAAWLGVIRSKEDFMDAPEAAIDFYNFNTTKPPTNDVRVRKALNMALNKKLMAEWRSVKPATTLTPPGIFPDYPYPEGDPFDPAKAKRLLAEAGYCDASGAYDGDKFQATEIEMLTNPDANNKAFAEFIQDQWKQNLGIKVSLRLMEGKTFFAAVQNLDYKGVSRNGWAADYMDPYSFLGIFYTQNFAGWLDPKYVELLDEANKAADHQKRFELLAQAEKILLDAQPIMPITIGTTRWLKKPYVKGMYPNPLTLHPWKSIYIERDPAEWDHGIPAMEN